MENIIKIFNSQDEKEVKQAIKDVLVEQVRRDLDDNDTYLFNPQRVEDMIHSAYEECIEEIKEDLKKMIKKQFKDNLSKISNESIVKVLETIER